MTDGYFYFADAGDGRSLHRRHALRSPSAVGIGTSYRGSRRKMSTTHADGHFQAHDRMRPAELVTLDLRFNEDRLGRLVSDHLRNGLPPGEPVRTASDYAIDADNDWDDSAVVDAHVYTGWTYDYFSARHGWEGIDGEYGRAVSVVNRDWFNAAFYFPPYGPEGRGLFLYGRYTDETTEEPTTWLN